MTTRIAVIRLALAHTDSPGNPSPVLYTSHRYLLMCSAPPYKRSMKKILPIARGRSMKKILPIARGRWKDGRDEGGSLRRRKVKETIVHSSPDFEEVLIPEQKDILWRGGRKLTRWPVTVRFSRNKHNGEQRSVHAAKVTLGGAMVGIYHGRLLDLIMTERLCKKWMISVPGYRGIRVLDSQICAEWLWPRYKGEGKVGGFFNSSRRLPAPHGKRNVKGANCDLVWFRESYGVKATTDDVWAALFVKESRTVLPGEELTHDYPWVK